MTELNLEKDNEAAYPYWKLIIIYIPCTGFLSAFITAFILNILAASERCYVLSCYFKYIIEGFSTIYPIILFFMFITVSVTFLFALVIILIKVPLSVYYSFPIAIWTVVFCLFAFFILYSILNLGADMFKGIFGAVAISVSLSSGFSSWIVWRFLIAEDHKISKK